MIPRPGLRALLLVALLLQGSGAWARLQTFGRVSMFEEGLEQAEKVILQAQAAAAPPVNTESPPATSSQGQDQGQSQSGAEKQEQKAASVSDSNAAPEAKKWPAWLPEESLRGHESDLDRVLEYHRIISPIAINTTVIVVPANLGFMDLAMNLYCRLQQLKATNVLIWALDGESSEKLKERGIAHIYDETLFSVSTAVGYGTSQENYSRMMSERPKVWWRILATGYNMLFLDADVVALDLPEKALEGSADFEGQLDYQARLGWGFSGMSNVSTICAGVFFIRSSPKSLQWMDLVTKSFKSREEAKLNMEKQYGHWDDQIALNYLLHDSRESAILNPGLDKQPRRGWEDVSEKQMSVLYAHPTKLLGGDMLERTKVTGTGYTADFSCQCQEQPGNFKPAVIHFNGRGKTAKMQAMKDNGWWELDESGSCKGASTPADASS